MAVGDTARLIASLELQDKFSGPLRGAERSLGSAEHRLDGVGRAAGRVGTGIGNVATAVARIGVGLAAAGVGVLAVNIRAGVDSLHELENVTVATNTVIDSTRGIAGQTAEEIRALAEEYENLNVTMDDKVIQSGANMLLTFTNIREEAFEPALAAALDMNEAMGGGPEGLQTTIIQVGKALNDPIQGVGALRRVGVQLSDQQEDQIKVLMEQNDLYGAQKIILDELTTQFGGRFAAAGDTAAGSQAKLRDRIEDVQMALAGPLLPAMDRVRDKLSDLLGSPRVLAGADKLGEAIAGLFSDENLEFGVGVIEDAIDSLSDADFTGATSGLGSIVGSVAGLPWTSIGDAARLLGTGAKALLDAFLGLPPWVQTAVLTGWGLNKLTGGALGGIVGELGKGLIRGVLGMNAGVVNINAAVVNGPGGPTGPGGKAPGKFPLIPVITAVALPLILKSSENVTAEMSNRQIELQKQINEGAITSAEAARLWMEAYGQVVANPFKVDITAGGKKFGTGTSDWAEGLFGVTKRTGTSDWAAGLNKPVVAVLPDTAMKPLAGVLEGIKTLLSAQKTGTSDWAAGLHQPHRGNFVETIKLDTSQVVDLREPTRLAAEQLREMNAWNKLLGNTNLQELRTGFSFTGEKLMGVGSKLDLERAAANAYRAADAGRIQSLRDSHFSANAKLGVIAAKNPIHPVTVNNSINIPVSISATLLEQRLVTARLASVGIPTAPRII